MTRIHAVRVSGIPRHLRAAWQEFLLFHGVHRVTVEDRPDLGCYRVVLRYVR